ncbi:MULTISPECIES: LysR substrate-binding domain-containing protein [Pseudomonas]|jgi:DNA-binding transcriptional LysR family regulator|uniref:HTH-type transcriptional regulator DmlR n=1 Tax=Pseudomonas fluorescens TaxID=294 RepID=A0A109KVG3_PSEFL|nr:MULTISPECIES: LysR substrate-binding domain-containing protein [Pseudomonas]KAA6193719.1 LysR family transcriptional regulator [Pseudomonas lactis]KRD01197.1 LysR family transcriptional regulator [Pseudomonas sp. Root9]KWV76176.1 HTH-type transcriptional regulator DmlR [Pseudomonas fluorescens]
MTTQAVLEDLNDLYYFSMVAEHGGFSAAGRVLGIPKSRLSARVAALEQRLGARLFHRTTRHVSLTDLGERFFIHCRASITEALAAQEVIDMASAAPRGLVRISCPVLATQVFLAPNLPAFMTRYPQVRVQVLATDRTVDLQAESMDIAVRLRQPEDMDPDLVAKPLGISRRILVASPDYLKRTGPLSHPDELAQRPTLYYEAADEPQPQWLLVGPDGSRTTARLRPTLMCREHETILNAAIQGLGIAMMPDVACVPALARQQLVVVLPEWSAPELTLHLAYSARRGMLPSVRALIDFLSEHLPQIVMQNSVR